MKTIVEPKAQVDNLWGKQRIREEATYRLMKYILRVDHDRKVLLHNVVTGRLVVLDEDEAKVIEKLPMAYCYKMEQLVTEHYLVPEDYDEHQQVIKLRDILRKLDDAQKPKGIITHYTILPTTACNARCYYCFEQGCETVTMDEETATNVVEFIASHCGEEKRVQLSWFGGEPTIAANRIDQICEQLQSKGVTFQSDITTNGYLLDETMVVKAVNLWKVKSCMICVDGVEGNYNKVKAYVHSYGNPYEKVMGNIAILLKYGVHVNLRMNFDLDNYLDFRNLIDEVIWRFERNPYLQVRAHPIYGAHLNRDGIISHADDSWFTNKVFELNSLAREAGVQLRDRKLPSIEFRGCQAYSESSVTITPKGNLVRCPEQFSDEESTGDVIEGITDPGILQSWKYYADLEMCRECCLLPICKRNERCIARDVCCYYAETIRVFEIGMVEVYKSNI